jgi:lipoprotein-anchoring transpeptidase ErfK/SrfK
VSPAKTFFIGSIILFGSIGAASWIKKGKEAKLLDPQLVEIAISQSNPVEQAAVPPKVIKASITPQNAKAISDAQKAEALPKIVDDVAEVDRIGRLFALDSSKLPIVETVSFTSRVPWLKGRPAWISDYASFYETSRHFIARSLNRKTDYFTQKVTPGARFNVFKKDKHISFHLLIDLSRCRMWFYYIDQGAGERTLLKTYKVGLGRPDSTRSSGYLTPTGKYSTGEKVAIYRPGTTGFFQDQKVEMVQVFGTRWVPFDKEIENCSEAAKGFGLHGAPWISDAKGQLHEDKEAIGKYDSDGCIRLASDDIEEIFAIILTKPTVIELVKDYTQAKLPGVEK